MAAVVRGSSQRALMVDSRRLRNSKQSCRRGWKEKVGCAREAGGVLERVLLYPQKPGGGWETALGQS